MVCRWAEAQRPVHPLVPVPQRVAQQEDCPLAPQVLWVLSPVPQVHSPVLQVYSPVPQVPSPAPAHNQVALTLDSFLEALEVTELQEAAPEETLEVVL